jgi:DNA gyrase/topoisomerase IV subunit A
MDGRVMKKAKQKSHSTTATFSPQLVSVKASDYVNTSSKEYAIYTAQNRAIPSSCDGLKDGQRKALWVIKNRSEKIKTISLAGMMISENIFHHGDSSASETISRLAAPYLNNLPLLEGIGAFGTKVAPDGWGAPRYTYVKPSQVTKALVYPDLDIVPLKPNYDGSVMEPENFLPLIPIVLLNGVSGIAVGWSTEILPHKFEDLVAATVAAIDRKPIPTLNPCYTHSTGVVKTLGDQSYEFAGRVQIEGDTLVRVVELPPDLSLERFRARLNTMEESDEIQSYTDQSTKNINVEIRVKRGRLSNMTEADVVSWLKLRSKTTQRLVVLDFNNRSIKQYDSAEDLVKNFVEWRVGWYQKRFNSQIDSLKRDLNFALAVKACVDKKLPSWLPSAQNKAEVAAKIKSITSHLELNEKDLDRLVGFPSYRWAKDSVANIEKEIEELAQKIVELETLVNDPLRVRAVYKKEVLSLLR